MSRWAVHQWADEQYIIFLRDGIEAWYELMYVLSNIKNKIYDQCYWNWSVKKVIKNRLKKYYIFLVSCTSMLCSLYNIIHQNQLHIENLTGN
jgi:hypothetical protein